MATNNDFESFTFPTTGDTFLPVAKVKVKAPFPFDLAFAMTVHKAQGRTILRVVLDLTEHPFRVCRMEYAAIFVALSRVRNSDHIRLLEPSTTASRTSLYEYLSELAPTPTIAPFLHGFPSSFAVWNAERALAYVKPKTSSTLPN